MLQLLEVRALFEFAAFLAAAPALHLLRRGDGHPVLVLPGFLADDDSTAPLRSVLYSRGYRVHGWHLGRNLGPTDKIMDGIHDRLAELHDRYGRPVSLVGWSLGGIYAREMARENPGAVRQVVTMGAPMRIRRGDRTAVSSIADRLSPYWRQDALRMQDEEHHRPPLAVPATSIYSRTDGVARWHTCLDDESDHRQNVEVFGSHSGLGVNPAVVYVVCDRLSQPVDSWRRFVPPLALAGCFPRPSVQRMAA